VCSVRAFEAPVVLSFFPASEDDFYFNEEDGEEFRPMKHREELPEHRFFLVALARANQSLPLAAVDREQLTLRR
jgi:hypothetical protein